MCGVSGTPTTAKPHQIRVHLQYLGYPIVNDQLSVLFQVLQLQPSLTRSEYIYSI